MTVCMLFYCTHLYYSNNEFCPPIPISTFLLLDNVIYSTERIDDHRETAISTITLTPTHDDNRALYSCEAVHKALMKPMISYIELSVLCKYFFFHFHLEKFVDL